MSKKVTDSAELAKSAKFAQFVNSVKSAKLTKSAKLPDGLEGILLIFQKNQEEIAAKKKKKDRFVEEQDLHESYQILLGVN